MVDMIAGLLPTLVLSLPVHHHHHHHPADLVRILHHLLTLPNPLQRLEGSYQAEIYTQAAVKFWD